MIISKEDKEFIIINEDKDISKLALTLSKSEYSRSHAEFILNQIAGRKVSKYKIKTWYNNCEIVYPPNLSMEQSSSELTAQYKTSILGKYSSVLDLTGGLGVDFYFLARESIKSTYIEQDSLLCKIAEHNFKALELENYTIINGSSEDYLKLIPFDERVIYVDPARRDNHGKKVFRIEDCVPNIIDIQDDLISKSSKSMIKFSPMLDISLALSSLKNIREVHVVSINNDCKELVFILSRDNLTEKVNDIEIHTVNIKKNGVVDIFSFMQSEEATTSILYADTLKRYLYEPNSSILKAGSFKCISTHFNVSKISPNSHIYTSDIIIDNFPGRVFEVKGCFNPTKRNIKEFVKENEKANITVRNYPMSVSQIRKTSNLKEGGDVYVFASTLNSGQKVWINCTKV